MILLVGLGNPGKEYENTRHNVGFKFIDELVKRFGLSSPKVKFKSEIYEGKFGQQKIICAKPLTYMNLSGDSVWQIVNFFKIEISSIIVVYDDMDIDLGKIKIKISGGAGGHNGIKSIDQKLGNKNYKRFRIGVGPKLYNATNHVLGKFKPNELEQLQKIIDFSIDNFESIIDNREDLFFNNFQKME